jgi:hypothetical protein
MSYNKCDDCFATATYIASNPKKPSWMDEYYCDHCVKINALDCGLTVTAIHPPSKGYMQHLPADGNFTEDDLWEAIAEANGVDTSEIMDGDLVEWL